MDRLWSLVARNPPVFPLWDVHPPRDAARRSVSALLWLGSLAFAYTTFVSAWEARLIVPYGDEWDFLTVYRRVSETGSFADIWAPFNGHYEPIPHLLFLGRDALLQGDAVALIVVSLLLQVGVIGILVAALLHEPRLKGSLFQHVLVASTIVLLSWTIQMENFHWSVQITFVLPTFLAVASIALVSWRPRGSGARIDWPVVIAGVMAVAACYSLGAGLGVWPALMVVAVTQRRGAQAIAILVAGAALSSAPYFVDGAALADITASLTRPLDIFFFLSRYLPPLYIRDNLRLVLGAFLLGLGLAAIGSGFLRGVPGRLGSLALGLITFGGSVALLTAIARVDCCVAASSRYMAFSSLYWVGLLILTGLTVETSRWVVARWALYGVLLYGLLPVTRIQNAAAEPFVDRAHQATAAVLSMIAGVPDEQAIASHLYPRPQLPVTLFPFLMERRYGFFGNKLVQAIGHPVRKTFRIGTRMCDADVGLEVLGDGLRLSGRYESPGGPNWLVIVGPLGNVRGLAVRERRGSEIVGYAPMLTSGTLFGVEGDTLCVAKSLRILS
jgi:hypothetical protein